MRRDVNFGALSIGRGEDDMHGKLSKSELGFLILILLLQIGLIAYFGSRKLNYHVDECLTYALSNNINGLEFNPLNKVLVDQSVFTDFFSVTPGHRFDYAMVWRNQTNDVHPPLYYCVIHTISSFFPHIVFSKWVGIGVNIFFAMMGTVLVFLLAKDLSKNKAIAFLVCILYGITPGFINSAVFIRMYMMVTLWFLCLAFLHVRQGQDKLKRSFYVSLFFISMLGALTHYYFLIFLFFLSLFFGMSLIFQKRFVESLFYGITLLAAGGVSYLLFPAMVDHIFHGYRGTASMAYFVQTVNLSVRFRTFYEAFNQQLFGGFFLWIMVVGLLFLIIKAGKEKISLKSIGQNPWTAVIFAVICYFVIISKSAPIICDRYLFPIYPFLFLFVAALLFIIAEQFFQKKVILLVMTFTLLSASLFGYHKTGVPYLYQSAKPIINLSKSYADRVCVIVYRTPHTLLSSYMEFKNYKGLIFIPVNQLQLLDQCGLQQYQDLLVYATKDLDPDKAMTRITKNNNNLTEREALLNEEYFYVFHMK